MPAHQATTDNHSPPATRHSTTDLLATDHRLHFDLPEANRRNLLNAGVRHVELAEHCTACRTDLFFSHRAEKGRTGRFGVVLGL